MHYRLSLTGSLNKKKSNVAALCMPWLIVSALCSGGDVNCRTVASRQISVARSWNVILSAPALQPLPRTFDPCFNEPLYNFGYNGKADR